MSLPPRAVTKARIALRDTLSDLPAGTTVAVACSGGADSLAVAAELVFVARKQGWQTAAFLIDHDMQEGSAEVTHNAALTCERLGVDIVATRKVTVGNEGGPESAARDARYAALTAMAHEHNAQAVLLGHTIDDQAETVLLGLNRGSGTRSLAGMRPRKGIFRRPFLTLSRQDTEAVCAHAMINYWVDPTNLETHDGPLRSQVRGRVLPLMDEVLGPKLTETLARTAAQLQEDADTLDLLASELYQRALVAPALMETDQQEHDDQNQTQSSQIHNATDLTLSVEPLKNAPRALRTRALRTAVIAAGAPAGTLKYSHIEDLEKLIVDWRGQKKIDLPDAHYARRVGGTIRISAPNLK